MKIALAGAGGTGKGTLGQMLACHYGLTFLPSFIKETGVSMGMINSYNDVKDESQHIAFQNTIMHGNIFQQRALELAGLGFVAERTTFDYIPYFLERGLEDQKYLDMARSWGKEAYDLIIYVPIEFEPSSHDLSVNSWKERDSSKQSRTDRIILQEISDHCPEKMLIVSGSARERFVQALRHIDKNINKKLAS